MSNARLDIVIALGRYRWSLALLAALSTDGARFVELLNKVGLSRDSLSRSLEKLVNTGWVKRNPGYGHPLRPEYLLTDRGALPSKIAVAVLAVQGRLGLNSTDMSRWSLALVEVLAGRKLRFKDIQMVLPDTTPRALSIGLKTLMKLELAQRQVIDSYPPITQYTLTVRGQLLAEALKI